MFSLKNKSTFIFGGATGIGLAVVKRFIAAGAKVMVADIHKGELEKLGVIYTKADVSDEAQVAAAFELAEQKMGKLDVIINNVGIMLGEGAFEEYPTASFEKMIEVNMKGVFYGLKYAPRHIKDRGAIINTASQIAFTKIPGAGSYAATKAAVVSMTKTAALELAPRKIRVNGIAPTIVDTPFYESMSEEDLNLCKNNIPLGRVSVPSDLAGAYHFLAAEESTFITGQILHVNGGWTAGLSYALLEKTTQ